MMKLFPIGAGIKYFFIICASLGLLSCTEEKTVLFLVDTYWYASGHFTETRITALQKSANRLGAELEIMQIAPEGPDKRSFEAIERKKADSILVSPLLRSFAEAVSQQIPDVPVILMSFDPDNEERPTSKVQSVGMIGISRDKAFEELGIIARDYPDIIGVWYVGEEKYKKEYEIFYDSYKKGVSADNINLMKAGNLTSGEIVDRVKHFEGGENTLGLAFASLATADCVKRFAEMGIGFAAESVFLDDFPHVRPLYSIQIPMGRIIELTVREAPLEGEVIKVDALLLKRE